MQELLRTIVAGLVEDPSAIAITEDAPNEEGVLPDAVCFEEESHYNGLLEYPQYTRPEVWHEQAVPPVLLSGHHKNIETWRFAASLQETKEKRPDLYAKYVDKK